jgi:hypothetical protein
MEFAKLQARQLLATCDRPFQSARSSPTPLLGRHWRNLKAAVPWQFHVAAGDKVAVKESEQPRGAGRYGTGVKKSRLKA